MTEEVQNLSWYAHRRRLYENTRHHPSPVTRVGQFGITRSDTRVRALSRPLSNCHGYFLRSKQFVEVRRWHRVEGGIGYPSCIRELARREHGVSNSHFSAREVKNDQHLTEVRDVVLINSEIFSVHGEASKDTSRRRIHTAVFFKIGQPFPKFYSLNLKSTHIITSASFICQYHWSNGEALYSIGFSLRLSLCFTLGFPLILRSGMRHGDHEQRDDQQTGGYAHNDGIVLRPFRDREPPEFRVLSDPVMASAGKTIAQCPPLEIV